uniref:RING-type domain-containing protein n=1 Tax=Heterorhabditis bacteriophora TaxID=37862 RepID=A0A1I7XK56_HETBA
MAASSASASGSMLSDTTGPSNLQELIECPICYLQYDRPLQLTCGHTFCASCVDRMVESARPNPLMRDVLQQPYDMDGVFLLRHMNYFRQEEQRILNGHHAAAIGAAPILDPVHLNGENRVILDAVGPENVNRAYDQLAADIQNQHRLATRRGGGTSIRCPECRKTTYVPTDGLPVNYRLQQMITRMAESSHENSVTTKTKLESLEASRCQLCEDPLAGGIYFSCKNCQEAEQLCSTCCIRKHNGHDIEEKRALTDRDLKDTKDRIGAQTGRAFHVIDQMQARLGQLTTDAREIIEKLLQDSVHSFEVIAAGLDTMQGNSLQTLEFKTGRATQLADKYDEVILSKVDAIILASRERCEELAVDFREFVRDLGVEMKREPNEDNSDVIVIDYPTELDFTVQTDIQVSRNNDASNRSPDLVQPNINSQSHDGGVPFRVIENARFRGRPRERIMTAEQIRRRQQMLMRGRNNGGVESNLAPQMTQNPWIQQPTQPCTNNMFQVNSSIMPLGRFPPFNPNPFFDANVTRGLLNVLPGQLPPLATYQSLPFPPPRAERSLVASNQPTFARTESSQVAGDRPQHVTNQQNADSTDEFVFLPPPINSHRNLILSPRRRGQSRMETEEVGRAESVTLRNRRWRRQDSEAQANSEALHNVSSPTTSPPAAKKKLRSLQLELNRLMPARTHVEGTSARTRAMADTTPTASTSQVETESMNVIVLDGSSNSNIREQVVEEGDMNVQGDADTESED